MGILANEAGSISSYSLLGVGAQPLLVRKGSKKIARVPESEANVRTPHSCNRDWSMSIRHVGVFVISAKHPSKLSLTGVFDIS